MRHLVRHHCSPLRGGRVCLAALLLGAPVAAQSAASPGAVHAPAAPALAPAPSVVTPAPRRHRILIMDLTPVGVDASLVTVLGGLITDAVARYPSLQTISTSDIRNLVELESGKQQVGCDTTSCLAEVAGAMGAEFVIFGNVGILGATTVVQLSLFDAAQAQAVARRSIKVATHDELAAAVEPAVADLLRGLLPASELALAPTPPPAATPPTTENGGSDLGWMLWLGGIAGGLTAVTLVGTYVAGLAIASATDIPPKYLQLMAVPVVGPLMGGERLLKQDLKGGDSGPPEWAAQLFLAWGGGQALMVLGTVGGLGVFALGQALDGQGLPLLGHLWQWGLLAASGGLVAGGFALDVLLEDSHDHRVGPTDFAGPALYALAATGAVAALFLNPFAEEGE